MIDTMCLQSQDLLVFECMGEIRDHPTYNGGGAQCAEGAIFSSLLDQQQALGLAFPVVLVVLAECLFIYMDQYGPVWTRMD